jgi:hypothetical protein
MERVLAHYADNARLRSIQKEAKFPKSFLELCGIVRTEMSKSDDIAVVDRQGAS